MKKKLLSKIALVMSVSLFATEGIAQDSAKCETKVIKTGNHL
jgi:hypothetical protein